MPKYLYLLSFLFFVACSSPENDKVTEPKVQDEDTTSVGKDSIPNDTLDIKSDYDLGTVDPKERKEFREKLAKIEKKHGVQWDFCTCIYANDSINEALQTPNLPDSKLDDLIDRLSVVEEKCQAFLVQSLDKTPEERARHEKKVRDCLKASK